MLAPSAFFFFIFFIAGKLKQCGPRSNSTGCSICSVSTPFEFKKYRKNMIFTTMNFQKQSNIGNGSAQCMEKNSLITMSPGING